MPANPPPVFRFAPSPNGALHLGHAYSALENKRLCAEFLGVYRLRIEDIDQTRCTLQLEDQMLDDLRWLGIEWAGQPRRQSQHFDDYAAALAKLRQAGLVYPAFMTRGDIRKFVQEQPDGTGSWPLDPDGAPHYPGGERHWSKDRQDAMRQQVQVHSWRLDMQAALERVPGDIIWTETGLSPDGQSGSALARPERWGDVVLARSDTPTSYHLAVTLDDALQEVSHVVRGRDLYHATSVHRLLQILLDLPVPVYHHHDLVLGDDGRKLSKSQGDVSLRNLRDQGVRPQDIPTFFDFSPDRLGR
jgi:glutamyl-Q tRNA(Asp) synthetase